MKKTTPKRKLVLNAETIKKLTSLPGEKLAQVAGGSITIVTKGAMCSHSCTQ
jgi:hypothetical protein